MSKRALLVMLLSLAALPALPTWALAGEGGVPRGPGLYFSIFKLLAFVAVYLCWVKTCAWADQDAGKVGLPTAQWNSVLVGCGLGGILLVWLLPWFWVSLLGLLVLYISSTLAYVYLRNQQVPAKKRILNKRHFQELIEYYFHQKAEAGEEEPAEEEQSANLSQLGMSEKMHEKVRALITQPQGLFLVCGPAGAGNNTVLYACIEEIGYRNKKVVALENPIECPLPHVTRVGVNPEAGKTFASELRRVMRQKPDVILLGEIPDAKTAELACDAAQAGHMVFAAIHADDAVTALVQLIGLGVSSETAAPAVSAVLGQRSLRLLCSHCKVPYKPSPDMLRKAKLPIDKIKHFYRTPADSGEGAKPNACSHCGGTGYHGLGGIFELLVVTDAVREAVSKNAGPEVLRKEAIKGGLKSLQEDGLRQVVAGKISIQELLRVCK